MSTLRADALWERMRNGVFIIAEIGKNFITTEEDQPIATYLANAKGLVAAAKDAGADAVKFQTHHVEDEQANLPIVSPHFLGVDRYSWVTRNTNATPLDTFWKPIKEYCDDLGIAFFSTPMSRGAAQKIASLDPQLWKIGSGDVQDFVMLDYVCGQGKPVIMSAGMVSLAELDDVVAFAASRNPRLAVCYCISEYPCPPAAFNLATIEHFCERYPDAVIGFSDHSLGYDAVLAAVRFGATIVEKHFSFDRTLWGADHKVSMTPEEMRVMISAMRSGAWRDADVMPFYGERTRELEGATNQFRPYFNKALVAGRDIPTGAIITPEMVYAVRPQVHIPGMRAEHFPRVIGKRLQCAVQKYDPITPDLLA